MKPQSIKLWIEALLYGTILLIVSLIYQFLQTNTINWFTLTPAFAFAGINLINLSFILSGLSYFWHIGITKLGHRKQYGVIGFAFVLIHAILSLQLFAGGIFSLSLYAIAPITYISPLIAIIIFTMMFLVSNFGIPAKIGAQLWRQLLRVGYIGIILFTIHLILLRYTVWLNWLTTFDPILPPLSLFLVIFSLATLGLRIALFFALRKKAKSIPPKQPPSARQVYTPPITNDSAS